MKKLILKNIPVSEEAIEDQISMAVNLTEKDKIELENVLRENVFSYREVLLAIMRSPLDPNSGITIEELEKSLDIIAQIKQVKQGEELCLDDVDFEYINLKLSRVRLNSFDSRWLQLRDDIEAAKSSKVT